MALTPDQVTTYTQYLADAVQAKHKLLTGTKAASVRDQNGELVTFMATNINALNDYIRELQDALGLIDKSMQPRPLRYFF